MKKHMYRTHHCNELRKTDIGREVKLAGWVAVRRDHGGVIFIDLRDREGLTQVVFRPEENAEVAKQSHSLRPEDVIQVSGKVAPRLAGTENPKLATGVIEVLPQTLIVLNRAENLPFQIAKAFRDEELRADRQPEFTQIDIEASFVTPNDIYTLTEGMLAATFKAARGIDILRPFPRLTYREAVDTFGSDKPDRRFGMRLIDLG